MIYIVITLFSILWGSIYLIFKIRNKTNNPTYKNTKYWLTCIFLTPVFYFFGYIIYGIILLNSVFGITDLKDYNIQYGNIVFSGEDDGLMYTDWIKGYDNNTFEIHTYNIYCNGHYVFENDTLFLNYNDIYNDTILPNFYIKQGGSLIGYRVLGNKIDSSRYTYLAYYEFE